MFNMILKYLRSGHLVQNLSSEVLSELEVEAEYYQLTSLLEIIQQRLSVEEQNNSGTKDEVNVFVEGKTFKCKPHALQYCRKELINQNGDFNARDFIARWLCPRQRNECGCHRPHGPTLEDLVRRILRRLEDNRVGDVEPPETELREDSRAAMHMGLLPGNPNPKWFY